MPRDFNARDSRTRTRRVFYSPGSYLSRIKRQKERPGMERGSSSQPLRRFAATNFGITVTAASREKLAVSLPLVRSSTEDYVASLAKLSSKTRTTKTSFPLLPLLYPSSGYFCARRFQLKRKYLAGIIHVFSFFAFTVSQISPE